eukprot:scaffold7382_cov283-Alexandrium_tamarense.AAC.1
MALGWTYLRASQNVAPRRCGGTLNAMPEGSMKESCDGLGSWEAGGCFSVGVEGKDGEGIEMRTNL